jgi:hypothetical protein
VNWKWVESRVRRECGGGWNWDDAGRRAGGQAGRRAT